MSPSRPTKPIVESPPSQVRAAIDEHALQSRIRQQEILANLGVTALKGTPFEHLLNETVRLSVEGLNAEFGKVLEYLPSEDRFVMQAGIGWDKGLVGRATVGADLESPAGFALRTGKPVISNHLESEQRFRTPDLLAAHGVRRAMNVILQGDGAPYGVLEVDSKSTGEFSEHDIAFLQGAANILGMAIERQRRERILQAAIEHQQVLIKEINHRVKNSLQLVASVLRLQMEDDPHITRHLQEASSRIMAIGRAHDRLYRSPQIERIELAGYLTDICRDMKDIGADRSSPLCRYGANIDGLDVAHFERSVSNMSDWLGSQQVTVLKQISKGANINSDDLISRAVQEVKNTPRGKLVLGKAFPATNSQYS